MKDANSLGIHELTLEVHVESKEGLTHNEMPEVTVGALSIWLSHPVIGGLEPTANT